MRGTAAKRLLLRRDIAKTIVSENSLGVPINTLLKKNNLQCSRPTLVKLLDAELTSDPTVQASLAPEWLNPNGPLLQTQPDNWYYVGRFPRGYWACKDTLI